MQKNILVLAVLLGVCMTGCGMEAVSSSDSSVTFAAAETTNVLTDAAEAVRTETTAVQTTTTVQTEISVTTVLTTANTDESVKTTAANESKETHSVAELVGEWSSPDTMGMTNTTMSILEDGTFYVRYALGGTRIGKVKGEQVDGAYYYLFCDDSDEPWIRYTCSGQPVNQLSTQQADGINFVRISLEDVAKKKLDNMTYIMTTLCGARNPQADEKDTLIIGDDRYELLEDAKLRAIDSNSMIAFEKLLEQTIADTLKIKWQEIFDECLLERDGKYYIQSCGPQEYHVFETSGGVEISDYAVTAFTATTKESNQMEGCGSARFVWDDNDWKIVKYEFQ